MPPRRASSSKSKSRSTSRTPRVSSPRASTRLSAALPPAPSKSPSLPPPDPAAVQRLIDEAIARAQRNRNNGAAAGPAASSTSAVSAPAAAGPGPLRAVYGFLTGSRSNTYSPRTTAAVTDAVGAFLVTCITVYFTVAGYLFYRELATDE